MARDTLEFSNKEDLQHLLQVSVADDFVRDYESTVKSITRLRKVYSWMSNGCSIAMLLTSFVSGVTAFANFDPVVKMIAGVATLSVGLMERAKAHADSKFKEATKDLAAAYKKCGLETFGVYDTTDSPGSRVARSPRTLPGAHRTDLEKLSAPLPRRDDESIKSSSV